jgi:hypothetical protein
LFWSAAACRRFPTGQLAGRNCAASRDGREQAPGLDCRDLVGPRASSRGESGSKLPHSKATLNIPEINLELVLDIHQQRFVTRGIASGAVNP